MRLVGILGGTFDPVHFGHLRMAQELANALALSEVRFIPTATPPHKQQPAISAMHRAEMVRLAIADNAQFVLDKRELDRAQTEHSPSYSIDTLISLRNELGAQAAICLLMGHDAFLGLASWHRWQELLDYCHIVVASRPGAPPNTESMPAPLADVWNQSSTTQISDLSDKAAGLILMQAITALDISATSIREDFKNDVSPRYLMPDCLITYINKYQLL
jgi:nicotinate-nucleotide adenylyltransferase